MVIHSLSWVPSAEIFCSCVPRPVMCQTVHGYVLLPMYGVASWLINHEYSSARLMVNISLLLITMPFVPPLLLSLEVVNLLNTFYFKYVNSKTVGLQI